MVKKIHPSQFPDQRHRVNSHRCQPRATQFNEKFEYTRAKPQLNPAWAAAAPGEHDPSAPPHSACPRHQLSRPNTALSIPPHTSQAVQRHTAQQPNTHRPASSKLGFEPVKCTGWGTPSAGTPKQLQYATLGLLHEILHGVFFTV